MNQRDFIYHPTDVFADIEKSSVAGLEQVSLTTLDGEMLVAWYLPPTDPDQNVILFFNGNGDSITIWDGRWRRIADAGVGFLAVSYRGYDGSTGNPTEEGLHRDAQAGYDWPKGRHSSSHIIIHGFSLGSGVATKLPFNVEA